MERELYASGLGLLISSRESLQALRDGANYFQPGEEEDRVITRLLDNDELMTLATGSPQLDYRIHVHEGPIPAAVELKLRNAVEAGLRVRGAALVIRDGYDLLDWRTESESTVSFDVPDGYYRLRIGWEPCAQRGTMILHFGPERSAERIPGQESLELLYSFERSDLR